MTERRQFKVVVDHARTEEFLVEARTTEEAESLVDALLQDGTEGKVLEQDWYTLEAYPVDEVSMGEVSEDVDAS